MLDFTDKVAVVTGAGSGIGRALAERCAAEGMRVALADINAADLAVTESMLRAAGATVLSVRTDVSKPGDVTSLAEQTVRAYGAVHVLMNNAGVMGAGAGTPMWETSLADWEWVLGVNLWGVIYGIRTFTPIMLAQDAECHIINTASVVGMLSHNPYAPYHASKHAVVALSENLYHSLAQLSAKVRVSVLCPGWVNTRIMDVERYVDGAHAGAETATVQQMRQAVTAGVSPQHVADCAFHAMRTGEFYIFTGDGADARVRQRMENILQRQNPD
jgi:NAD(P)-dependent dehydrogenase (short-subunit alcohol dehydrogenase family)